MGYRLRRARAQARPIAGERRRSPGPRARTWLGWAAAAAGVVLVAFLVGRAGSDAGLPSPTPSPSAAGPVTIAFGTALDPATGEAINPTDRFRASEPIAYSFRLPVAPATETIMVEIVQLGADGETVVQEPSPQGIAPSSTLIGFTFAVPTSELLDAWGPGDYEMRITLPARADLLATGRFTLVETPVAS